MIDLTKMALEEVRELVEGAVNGGEVIIYSNSAGGSSPIHGAYKHREWCITSWDAYGKQPITAGISLKLKPKSINFSKLPVDTLVNVKGYGDVYAAPPAIDGIFRFFADHRTSMNAMPVCTNVGHEDCKLIEGRIEPWFGGECPLPKGVEVNLWYIDIGDDGSKPDDTCCCSQTEWGEVYAYQITGNIV